MGQLSRQNESFLVSVTTMVMALTETFTLAITCVKPS